MSDKELINFLIAMTGGPASAARALGGISTKCMFNWRRRSIPILYRPAFRTFAERHGVEVPAAWRDAPRPVSLILDEDEPSPQPRSRTNGRKSTKQRSPKAQGKIKASKRQGPQQPGRAA